MKQSLIFACVGIMLALSGCATAPTGNDVASPVDQLASLTAKYLPGYTLRAEDRGGSSPVYLLVGPAGAPLPDVPGWQGLKGLTISETNGYEYMGSPQLNVLLREHKVRVASRAQASEVTTLVTGLGRGSWVLDKEWKYHVKKIDGGWLVEPEYVGPPAMVLWFGACEVLIDPAHQFIELRERNYNKPTSNKSSERDVQ